MYRRLILPVMFLTLAYGFWVSPTFRTSPGVARFSCSACCAWKGFFAPSRAALWKSLLRASTDKTWKSLSFGILTTTVMRSSSPGLGDHHPFLSAGLIGLAEVSASSSVPISVPRPVPGSLPGSA